MFTLLLASFTSFFGLFGTTDEAAPLVALPSIDQLYQPGHNADFHQTEIDFWSSKLDRSPEQLTYNLKLAAAYEARFSATAHITDLKQAETLLTDGLPRAGFQRSIFLRALARNYISQHRFQEALVLAEEAMQRGDVKLSSTYLLFDVYMEVGRYAEAEALLQKMHNKGGFAYFIRKAKWEDYRGNLDFAINRLEEAKAVVNPNTEKAKAVWLYSNLGDFYGHQGSVEKAYDHYRMTLELDPGNWYAYKGLAWIAYAHDDQPAVARRMVHRLMRSNDSPDLHLLLAEIYAYEQDDACAAAETETFRLTTTDSAYGHMYRIPNCEIALADGRNDEALTWAAAEVQERPTPETYDLLAWVNHQVGQVETAQSVAREHVWEKTFEPVAMTHLKEIFPNDPTIQAYTEKELVGTEFELGPVTYAAIPK